jgi:hypothetical protein
LIYYRFNDRAYGALDGWEMASIESVAEGSEQAQSDNDSSLSH